MGKMIKLLAVCGNGVGSSMIVKMALDDLFHEEKIYGDVECTSVAQAAGMMAFVDAVLVSKSFYNGIKDVIPEGKKVIIFNNLLDKEELSAKVREFIKERENK
jgi:PTS system ascorbate-specific IIB component